MIGTDTRGHGPRRLARRGRRHSRVGAALLTSALMAATIMVGSAATAQAAVMSGTTTLLAPIGDVQTDCDFGGHPVSASWDGRYLLMSDCSSRFVRRDLVTGTDLDVLTNTTGLRHAYSSSGQISSDGQIVHYVSHELFAPVSATQVVVNDLSTGLASIVSTSSDGTLANAASRKSVMSANGQWVLFASSASNLVPGTSLVPADGSADNLYRKNLVTGALDLAVPTQGAPTSAGIPRGISDDGNTIAFDSSATNIVGVSPSPGTAYLRDMTSGVVQKLTYQPPGAIAPASANAQISADGKVAAFLSTDGLGGPTDVVVCAVAPPAGAQSCSSVGQSVGATGLHLAAGGTALEYATRNTPEGGTTWQIVRTELPSGTSGIVSASSAGVVGDGDSHTTTFPNDEGISGDGKSVFFISKATNLASGATFVWEPYLWTASAAPPPPPPSPLRIAALGDSVASGEGTGYKWSYVLNTDKNNGKNGEWNGTWTAEVTNPIWEPVDDLSGGAQNCHRSRDGYPYLVAAALGADLLNLSCSGASTTNGILASQKFADGTSTGRPQLGTADNSQEAPNTLYDHFRPDIVTLTLGADDVDFASILANCYYSAQAALNGGAACCDSDPDLNAQVDELLQQQKTNLESVITEVVNRGKTVGKVPMIAVTTYYDPFPVPGTVCDDIKPKKVVLPFVKKSVSFGLSTGEVKWLESKRNALNDNISAVVRNHPETRLVHLDTALDDHKWCSPDPWAYGASIRLQPGQDSNPSPFHPTPAGQGEIARRVIATIDR